MDLLACRWQFLLFEGVHKIGANSSLSSMPEEKTLSRGITSVAEENGSSCC